MWLTQVSNLKEKYVLNYIITLLGKSKTQNTYLAMANSFSSWDSFHIRNKIIYTGYKNMSD